MNKKTSVAVALTALACSRATVPPDHFPPVYRDVPANWTLFGRTRGSVGSHAMVVTEHPIASQVGARILHSGGNAVDAGVAIAFTLAVVHPTAGNIGGGGFMIYRAAGDDAVALDFREKAPAAATADMYIDSTGHVTEASLTGHLAVGVPGSVAGLLAALDRYGSLPRETVLAPAIDLAANGFALDDYRARAFTGPKVELFDRFDGSREKFLGGGAPPGMGNLFVQPDLAQTLRLISDSGPAGFYAGRVADLIVAEMERGGGLITHEDLAGYEPVWRDPVRVTYRGYTIYSMPPSSSGGVTMGEILNILEGYDSLPVFGSASQVHLMAEAMRRAFIDRNSELGDPDFVPLPLNRLLSKGYAASLRATIDPARATPTPATATQLREGESTTHFSVVDADGNAVSITTTLNSSYGSAVVVSGAGFLLNNEMDDFTSAPGQPNQFGLIQGEANAIAPGKRMLSAMTPTVVVDSGDAPFLILGAPGGPRIISAVTQVISNVIDHGMSLAEAVGAPRVHHQSLPDEVFYERTGLSDRTIRRLERMGHTVTPRGSVGIISAIMATPNGWIGVADPRGGGRPAGY